MKNLIVMVLIAAGGYFAYQSSMGGSSPIETYKSFSKEWAKGDFDKALEYVADGELKNNMEAISAEKIFPWNYDDIIVKSTKFEIKSENSGTDGDSMTLKAKQRFYFDPPGVASQAGAMFADFNHQVELKKSHSGWKVVSFTPEFLQDGETERYKKSFGG